MMQACSLAAKESQPLQRVIWLCICCRCLGIPAAFVIFVTQAYFLAAKSPLMPLKAAAFAGVVNLIGDLALVNGLGWGIAGASLATAAAQVNILKSPK